MENTEYYYYAKSTKIIGVLLGIFIWVVGDMVCSNYACMSYSRSTRIIAIIITSTMGALPGLLWHMKVDLGKAKRIIIGSAIGVFAVLYHKEMLLPFILSVFFIEIVSIVLQLLYYRQVRKNRQGKGFRHLQLIRFQNGKIAFFISPPVHIVRDAKTVTRLWLVQFILSVIVLTLVKT